MSAKTKRTSRSRASLTTSRFAEGRRNSVRGVEFIDCYRQAESELIVRTLQRTRADLGNLAQTVEDRVTMDVQFRRGRLHILSDFKVKLECSLELGLMFVIVST